MVCSHPLAHAGRQDAPAYGTCYGHNGDGSAAAHRRGVYSATTVEPAAPFATIEPGAPDPLLPLYIVTVGDHDCDVVQHGAFATAGTSDCCRADARLASAQHLSRLLEQSCEKHGDAAILLARALSALPGRGRDRGRAALRLGGWVRVDDVAGGNPNVFSCGHRLLCVRSQGGFSVADRKGRAARRRARG